MSDKNSPSVASDTTKVRRQMTLDEYLAKLKEQGVKKEELLFICPSCQTMQCAKDLIEAGAGKDFEGVEKYLGYSCVGRWSKDKGCNWTLGGLFQIHELEVITPDGEKHPRFLPANA